LNEIDLNTALLVVDMQLGFDDASWGARNNAAMEAKVAALIRAWRVSRAPVFHVHHVSASRSGRFRMGEPGNAPKPEANPLPHEPVYRKCVNSAFLGTDLEADLRDRGIETVVIVGLTTNHCISTTARMAANLGFDTFVVVDATAAFESEGLDGRRRSADVVHHGALSDLQHEFAKIIDTQALLRALARACREEGADAPRLGRIGCPGLY